MARLCTNDNINFGDKAEFILLGDVSWAAWIQLGSSQTLADMLMNVEGGTGEAETENTNLMLDIRGTSGSWDFLYNHEYGGGTNQLIVFNANIANDTWTHLGLVRDSAAKTVKLYKDLALVDTYTYTTNPTYTGSTAEYHLGARAGGASPADDAAFAEAVLDDSVWTVDDFRRHYWDGVFAVIDKVPVSAAPLWGDSSPEPDFSVNGFDGVLTGTVKADHPPAIGVKPPSGLSLLGAGS